MAKIITNLADVPDGWVRIADITDSVTDQKILSDAHNADVIPAVKLVRTTSEFRIGPVWVDPVAAKALLGRCQAKRDGRVAAEGDRDQRAGSAVRVVVLDDCAERIAVALERIADAVCGVPTAHG
jgi:hypothetical protein